MTWVEGPMDEDGPERPAVEAFPEEWPRLLRKDGISFRQYQWNIFQSSRERSTLVVLPTGLGKSLIFQLLAADMLERSPTEQVLIMAPTKPLVRQHEDVVKRSIILDAVETSALDGGRKVNHRIGPLVKLTGETPRAQRKVLWDTASIIVSTPQVIRNDLQAGTIDLARVSLIVFDECHRATGDYAYVPIASAYKHARSPEERTVLGLTASPGHDDSVIGGICRSLGIRWLEFRDEEDDDVSVYVQDRGSEWIAVDPLPEMERSIQLLRPVLDKYVRTLRKMGFMRNWRIVTAKALLSVQGEIQARMKGRGPRGMLMQAMSFQASCMKLNHLISILETQELHTVMEYVEKLEGEMAAGKNPAKRIVGSEGFAESRAMLQKVLEGEVDHPKALKVAEIVQEEVSRNPESKVMVFAHFRGTAARLTQILQRYEGISVARFVGQANRSPTDSGLKQKDQERILDSFRQGNLNCLVATSVGEEGLDVPETDLVIFFEPVASEIRLIQRRGRTARHRPGRVIILFTRGTRDTSAHWSSRSRERKMRRILEEFREKLDGDSGLMDGFDEAGPGDAPRQVVELGPGETHRVGVGIPSEQRRPMYIRRRVQVDDDEGVGGDVGGNDAEPVDGDHGNDHDRIVDGGGPSEVSVLSSGEDGGDGGDTGPVIILDGPVPVEDGDRPGSVSILSSRRRQMSLFDFDDA